MSEEENKLSFDNVIPVVAMLHAFLGRKQIMQIFQLVYLLWKQSLERWIGVLMMKSS